ncbi:hypothetical protein ACMBCN_02510, partial [Candidatus Liberibacter asiaticus]|nr:hypothetical protein [Candidatus Liberibacter asiaticus]
EVLYLKKSLNDKCTMINPAKQENLKGKEVKSSIETEKKGIKIPKIENEKIGSNNPESNNKPEKEK